MKMKIVEDYLGLRLENYHDILTHLIYKHGKKFEKKHGYWIKLDLEDNKFIEMDSHNQAITLKMGSGEPYDKWMGFPGEKLIYFGINFGGYEGKADKNQYRETIKEIEGFYGK
jgi:hypothetical protein